MVSLPASSCAFTQLHETVLKDRRPTRAPRLKYPLPSSGVLISVATDQDVEQMLSVWEQCTDTHNWMQRQLFVVDREPLCGGGGAAGTPVRHSPLTHAIASSQHRRRACVCFSCLGDMRVLRVMQRWHADTNPLTF